MARFVKFPGVAGSYASTDDVNLLDADTAHIQQSVGHWEPANEGEIPVQSPLNTTFGDFSLLCESLGTGPEPARTVNEQTGSPAVTVGNQYTVSYDVTVDLVGYEARAKFLFRDAGTGNRLEVLGTYQPLTSGVPLRLSVTATAPAVSAYIQVFVNFRKVAGSADPDVGDKIYVSSVSVAEGSSSAFVPSLRIVGDLDVRCDLSAIWAAPQDAFARLWSCRNAPGGGFNFVYRESLSAFRVEWETAASGVITVDSTSLPPDGTRGVVRFTGSPTTGLFAYTFAGNDIGNGSGLIGQPLGTGIDPLFLGATTVTGANPLTGDVHGAEVRDGIDGPIVAVFDPDDIII